MIRRIGMYGLACFALGFVTFGCTAKQTVWFYPHARHGTLSETPDEHYHRVVQIESERRRALVEDLDVVFMSDRPTRLTRWHSK